MLIRYTWVVPAAPCGGAHPPVSFKLVVAPVAHIVTWKSVWSQITDLQLRELLYEVRIRHPDRMRKISQVICYGLKCWGLKRLKSSSSLTRTLHLQLNNPVLLSPLVGRCPILWNWGRDGKHFTGLSRPMLKEYDLFRELTYHSKRPSTPPDPTGSWYAPVQLDCLWSEPACKVTIIRAPSYYSHQIHISASVAMSDLLCGRDGVGMTLHQLQTRHRLRLIWTGNLHNN